MAMNDKTPIDQNWTHNQLRSLVNAMKQRSRCDAEVNYYEDQTDDPLKNDTEPDSLIPTQQNK